jgi:hypothetical protein
MVGGKGNYLDKGSDNLYFLSGTLAALDAPGEWFIDDATGLLHLWMPDSAPPGDRAIRLRPLSHQHCINVDAGNGAPVHLSNVTLEACSFQLLGCNGCSIADVTATHPTYERTIPMRDVETGR